MRSAKLFRNGGSQAVRLPKEFQFESDEVVITKIGHALLMVPKEDRVATFRKSLNLFTDDFMREDPDKGEYTSRVTFDD